MSDENKLTRVKSTNALAFPTPTDAEPQRSPQEMLALALTNGADPAVLGRLMDLQDRWEATQAKKAYVLAMTAFKAEAPAVLKKDAVVDFTSSKGRTRYKHATLGGIINTITVALSKHGLSVSWETVQASNAVKVTCHVTHVAGHRESTSLQGPPDDSGNKNAIQQIGSAVTYLQRYTLLTLLGLATGEQDDADDRKPVDMPVEKSATKPTAKPPPSKPQSVESDGVQTVTGTLKEISVRESPPKAAKPWKKWGVKLWDNWYGTFDEKIGARAEILKGEEVIIEFTVDDKGYNNIYTLRPAVTATKEAIEEELPLDE